MRDCYSTLKRKVKVTDVMERDPQCPLLDLS